MVKSKFSAVAVTFLFCYALWLLFTWSLSPGELIAGAAVSLGVAFFSARFFVHNDAPYMGIRRMCIGVFYCLFVFFPELWKANMDVAKRALKPRIDVDPGIVRIPVDVKSEYGITALANAITLTPGTITMEIAEEGEQCYFYVHWIDAKTGDEREAGDIIKGRLEKWVRRIFD